MPYVAGIGAGIEDTDGQPLSNILLLADRIAMINPEDGQHHAVICGAGESVVHERCVPEAAVCGEYHVIRQPRRFP
ncbi:phage tail tip fiber protein [Escherichia coli]|uniref:phage tail tip fiber protein n=1 Tax=Escherichia coli TaxID=562 RepID=UPI003D9B34B3